MSAACKTGYVNNPALSNDSSTSDLSFAFREVANRDCDIGHQLEQENVGGQMHTFHVVILRNLPIGVIQLNIQANSA